MKKLITFLIITILLVIGFGITKEIKDNQEPQKIAFFGDSITQLGWDEPTGYIHQVISKLRAKGYNVEPIPAGVGGDTTRNLLERMDNDIIAKKPNVLILMIGVNDAIHHDIPADEYENNMNTILNKAALNKMDIIMTNITLGNEDLNSEENEIVDSRNKILKRIATEQNIILVDVNSKLKEAVRNNPPTDEFIVTSDNLHLNELGDTIVADEIVKKYTEKFKK